MKKLAINTIKRQFSKTQAFRPFRLAQAGIAQNPFYQHSHLRYFSTSPPQDSSNSSNINQGSAETPENQDTEQGNYVHEIQETADWERLVMKSESPVILDCYADWCQPCKQLTPVLEALTQQNQGKFSLVKINIDKHQKLASGLRVTSIPAVFLVYQGAIVDQFVGIPPQQKFGQFMQTAVFLEAIKTDPHIMESLLEKAQEFITNKNWENAEGILMEGYQHQQWHEKFGGQLLSGIAYVIALKNQDFQKAEDTLKMITEEQIQTMPEFYKNLIDQTKEEIQKIKQNQVPDDEEKQLLSKLSADEKDFQARYDLGKLQFSKGKNQEAIETLLVLMKQNKNWNEKAAYTLLLEIFTKMGNTNQAVIDARKRLSKILF